MPAPYSDNLYSADSDDEPDALSPTDGYFHASSESSSSRSGQNVPHVPNVLVEDPTQLSRDAKIQEAERERRLLNTGGSAGCNPESTASSHENASGSENPIASTPRSPPRASLFAHPVDAPPAYSPSPTTTSPPTTVNNYQTFASTATMGRPEENRPLINHAPESMSSPYNSAQQPSRWQQFKDSVSNFNIRKKVKTVLASLLIFSVVFMIFSSFTMQSNHGSHSKPVEDNDPVAPPADDGDDFDWNPSRTCLEKPQHSAHFIEEIDIQSDRNLSIIQRMVKSNDLKGWSTHVSGEVILRPVEDSSPASIELQVISNHDNLRVKADFNKTTQVFEIKVPRRVDWSSSDKAPCIQIRITVSAHRETILDHLNIETQQLDVNLKEGVVLGVQNGVNIRSASGDITSPGIKTIKGKEVVPYTLSSREIRIHTASGDVKGWYPLYDLLDIETASGDIITNIGPKPVNPQNVRPAEFRVRSASGTVKIDEPLTSAQKAARPDREFPPRDYTVDIITASGDITADVAASSLASFKSQSGDMKLQIWPVLDSSLLTINEKAKPTVITDTKSGDTHVTILEPLWTSLATIGETIPPVKPYDPTDGSDPYIVLPEGSELAEISMARPVLSVLHSKHKSVSGKIELYYPNSWEGMFFANSISGSQEFKGKDVTVDHGRGSIPPHLISGRKGKGISQLDISTVSGDQFALLGEEA
ncbi:hypothetical protein AU210_011525 [Fusarium oxysporum f. sp. radicis-cucumerinum]|uniref:DUF4097 domain-containing protein n=1 Tax=Fusarium oxysporum f. sp. radicis-cucumerinum TaxID=327505 RepID=A0A2H3GGQ2_FUSOX|nr:hypothetical protein AU210_011525 [Fusarium oxysporum f. sp. radicis-cucumerinum]